MSKETPDGVNIEADAAPEANEEVTSAKEKKDSFGTDGEATKSPREN